MTAEQPPTSLRRRYGVMGVKLAVSVVLLVVLFERVDMASLWSSARRASILWLLAAFLLNTPVVIAGTWRWRLLLEAQHIDLPPRRLLGSFLVASFFNNFLPSNIGGDVIRIKDTARAAGSKTLATTIVAVDRTLGLLALVLVAAIGASLEGSASGRSLAPIWPSWLWAGFLISAAATVPAVLAPAGVGRLLQPLTVVHPEWVGDRIATLTAALARFRQRPGALAGCFTGAVFVQGILVVYYLAVAYALQIPIAASDLAVIVPISFVVQMLPISVNGFGVREAIFSFYFSRLGLPIQSAILMSLFATALTMLFSLSGAAVYVTRRRD